MNKDNMLIKIITTYNNCIFNESSLKKVVMPKPIAKVISYSTGLDELDNYCIVENLFGNVDICFIYGKNPIDWVYDIISVDDNRGTRIIVLINTHKLLNSMGKIKPTAEFPYCYKAYTKDNNIFIGYCKKYEVFDRNLCIVKEKDFEEEGKYGEYILPMNSNYINYLREIFFNIIMLIKPQVSVNTTISKIYKYAPLILALYSHKITIGPITTLDYRHKNIVDLVNDNELEDLLEGKFIIPYDQISDLN